MPPKSNVSPRDTCKHCSKTFSTRYTRKRHEERCCTKGVEEGMANLTVSTPSAPSRSSSSPSSASRLREEALEVLMNRAAIETGHKLPITTAVRRLATAAPSVYRKTKALPATEPLRKNIEELKSPLVMPSPIVGEFNRMVNMAWSSDSRMVATGSATGKVFVRDAETGAVVASKTPQEPAWAIGVAWTPEGSVVIGHQGTSDNGYLRVWDPKKGGDKDTRDTPTGHEIRTVAVSPDGRHVAITVTSETNDVLLGTVSGKGTVRFRELDWPEAHNYITDVAFSPDGAMLAAAEEDIDNQKDLGRVTLWDVKTRKQIKSWGTRKVKGVSFSRIAWSPDQSMVATAVEDSISVWSVKTGRMLNGTRVALPNSRFNISGISWSPDGQFLSAGIADMFTNKKGLVHVWKISTVADNDERQVYISRSQVVGEYETSVNAVGWSPDGTRLAALCNDGTVRVWNRYGMFAGGRGGRRRKATA